MPSSLKAVRTLTIALLIVVPACSIWDSATAYFNTYYNAQRVYSEAEDELWNQREAAALGRHYYLAPMGAANKTKFTSVIEKCSKLLQYHGESNLVDDALLMIGMSYYYQMDNQQSDRKFRELIDRNPEGPLALQAGLMRGYAAYRSGDKDSAEVFGRGTLAHAEEEGEDEMIGQAALLLGQIARDRSNGPAAAAFFLRAGETAENPELRTTAFLIGAGVADTLGEYARAESLYQRANQVTRTYVGEFRGRFGVARMRGRLGDFDGGVALLEELRENQNYREFFPEIDLELATLYRDEGDLESAITQYRYVDTAYARTESAARAAFALGKVFENERNYDSAYVAYSRGRGHGVQFSVGPALNQRTEAFARLLQIRNDLRKTDSTRSAAAALRDSLLARPDSTRRAPSVDSLDQRMATLQGDLANLFFLSLGRNDSASAWYRRLIANAPQHPSVPRALFTLAQIEGSDSLYRECIARFPDSEFADEARRILGIAVEKKARDAGEEEYHRVEKLLLEGKNEEAIAGFRGVADRFPSSPYASRAQYAIGWMYENQLHLPDSAIANYQALVSRFPTSPLVVQVRPKLVEVQAFRAALKGDSTAVGKKPPPGPDDEIKRERPAHPVRPPQKPGVPEGEKDAPEGGPHP